MTSDTLARFQARAQQLEAAGRRDLPPEPAVLDEDGRPVWFPPDAILTVPNVARLLAVSERTVERWPLKWSYLSKQTKRVLFKYVVEYLEGRAA